MECRISHDCHIKCVGFSVGAANALTQAHVKTVGDVARLILADGLGELRHVGTTRKAEIENVMREIGLHPLLTPCVSGDEHVVQMGCPVRCLGVDAATVNALAHNDARTVAEVIQLIVQGEIRDVRNLGALRLARLKEALSRAGLQVHAL